MVIKVLGEAIPCTHAEKGADFVRAFDRDGLCIYEAKKVTDFSLFKLEGGEWGEPELSDSARISELEALMADLLFGGTEFGGEGE